VGKWTVGRWNRDSGNPTAGFTCRFQTLDWPIERGIGQFTIVTAFRRRASARSELDRLRYWTQRSRIHLRQCLSDGCWPKVVTFQCLFDPCLRRPHGLHRVGPFVSLDIGFDAKTIHDSPPAICPQAGSADACFNDITLSKRLWYFSSPCMIEISVLPRVCSS